MGSERCIRDRGYPGAAGETRMTFKTSNNATGETDRMTLDHDGNFGIGTTTPPKTLDVVGNVSASQEISASSFWGDGSGLTNVPATETDTLATVTARGATTTTPVLFNTHITASSGINSGPLHVAGSSVHSGTIDMYSGGGLYLYGENGIESGSLKHSGGGLLLGNTFGVPVGIMAPNSQAFMSNGAASVEASGTDVNLTPDASGKVAVAGVLSASLGITASSFVGDGSGLTGVTGEWDGTHDGNAEITGTLTTRAATNLEFVSAGGSAHGGVSNNGAGVLTLDGASGGMLKIGSAVSTTKVGATTVFLSSSSGTAVTEGNHDIQGNITGSTLRGQYLTDLDISSDTANVNLNADGFGIYMNTNTVFVTASMQVSGNTEFLNNVSASTFQGDGSGLTNLPASSWDGQLDGDAGITGSLDVSGSTEFGNEISTDTHIFTGSLHLTGDTHISGAFHCGTEDPEEHHRFIGTLLVDAAGVNNSELIVDGPNPNYIKLNRNSSTAGMLSTDGSKFTLYGGTAGFAGQIYDSSGDDRGIVDLAKANGLISGTKHKLNISASTNALRVDTNTATNVLTVQGNTTGLTHLSASGQIYGNGYDNGTKTANFTIDWDNGSNQMVSVSGAAATGLTASFSNIKPWSTYQFIYQVEKTSMELYLNQSIYWPGGTRPSLSNVSGSRDIITFTTDGDSNMYAVAQFNFSASVG